MNEKQRFIEKVWPKVCEYLNNNGPYKYGGYKSHEGWRGPYIWNEDGDLVRLITKYCEDEFDFDKVHNESKIDKFCYEKFDPEKDGNWKSIDIDVTDATRCERAEDFRNLQHTLFIKVKHIFRGQREPKRQIQGFEADCKKLQEQIEKERCEYAIAILIDDGKSDSEPYVENKGKFIKEIKKVYPNVEPLIWSKTSK